MPNRLFSTLALVSVVLLAAGAAGAANTQLKEVMKTMGATAAAGDAKGLSPIFDKVSAAAPKDPAFPDWAALATKGKAAADKGDLAGAKAVCKECHGSYRDAYRTKYGSKAP
jgi:hypothetical protein